MSVRFFATVILLLAGTVSGRLTLTGAQSGDPAESGQPRGGDWPLHNLDVRSSRYFPGQQINASNVANLALKWSFQMPTGSTIGSATPIVVDGVMYVNSGSKLFAIDAVTGKPRWTAETESSFPGDGPGPTGRGPAYGDGRVYAYGPTLLYAVDAKTGKLVRSFGENGVLRVVKKALEFKYPGKHLSDADASSLGYSMTNPPTYFNGTLYIGLPFSDSLIPGGLLVAIDGATGAIKWAFNTVPQGPQDDGWEIAKNTWSGNARQGGGIWTPPAIDPDLGLLYFNAGNPSPNYDGSSRKGANLFTNSLIALSLETGKLVWHYQAIHHDIWDWDLSSGPVLFDLNRSGKPIKGVASFGKNCHVYLFNRETGQPLNPMVETVMPTKTDVPGEEVWPTQPIPHASAGQPLLPFCSTYPVVRDPDLMKRVRQQYYPYQANEFVITAPGNVGGANRGSSSFSPRTGLLYVTGKNDAWSIKVKPVGDRMKPGPGNMGHFGLIAERGETGVTPTMTLSAYEPDTGRRAWHTEVTGSTNGGNLVTAGDVVFQGIETGAFYGFDARTGKELFKFMAKGVIRGSPLTYVVGGKQYVSIATTNTVFTLALP